MTASGDTHRQCAVIWIVNAASDMSSEDPQTTLPIVLILPVTSTGQFEGGEWGGGGD